MQGVKIHMLYPPRNKGAMGIHSHHIKKKGMPIEPIGTQPISRPRSETLLASLGYSISLTFLSHDWGAGIHQHLVALAAFAGAATHLLGVNTKTHKVAVKSWRHTKIWFWMCDIFLGDVVATYYPVLTCNAYIMTTYTFGYIWYHIIYKIYYTYIHMYTYIIIHTYILYTIMYIHI